MKKVKEEAVLDSGRADFQRAIQEHTHSNTDFLISFLSMLGLIFLVEDLNTLPLQQRSPTSKSNGVAKSQT